MSKILEFPKRETNLVFVTHDAATAFAEAQRWAVKGYKVKLYGIKGSDWTVEVQGMGE